MLKNNRAAITRPRSASLPSQYLQKKTKRPVPVVKPLEKAESMVEAERGTRPGQPEVATTATHGTPLSPIESRTPPVLSEATPATRPARPRTLSVGTHNLSASPARTQPARTAAEVTPIPRTPQRQADVQRLLVGTEVDALMTSSGIQVEDLDKKPGLQALLSNTVRTANDGANVAAFLREVGPAAERLSPSQLDFLYKRKAALTGRQGLKEFLVTRLGAAADEGTLSNFIDKLRDTEALNLPADRLDQVYRRGADVLDNPGLKEFLLAAHAASEDIAALDDFVTESHDGPVSKFNASQLAFLYKQRANLRDKPGLKDFAIEALGGGEAVEDVDAFLAESKDERVAAFGKEQAEYLYTNRARVQDHAGLKELVVNKLASSPDWKRGLDEFLPAMAGLKTDKLGAGEFEYLYALRGDLEKAVTGRPGPSQSTTVKALAVDRLTDESLSPGQARAEIEDLRGFGYKGTLLDSARTNAASRADQQLKQALASVGVEETQAVAAARTEIAAQGPQKPAGAEPVVSGSGRDRKNAVAAQAAWKKDNETYNQFQANEFPSLVAAKAKELKAAYDLKRSALKRDKDVLFLAPELENYRLFAAKTGYHDDAEWALAAARGDIDQAGILFEACKDEPELKVFGAWAAKRSYAGQKLEAILGIAKDLGLNADKAQAVAPYLADCSDGATRQWLEQRAGAKSAQDLAFEVGLLAGHTAKTLAVAISAIEADPGQGVLTKYNKHLARPDLGPELLRVIKNGDINQAAVAKIVDAYAEDQKLVDFLKATNPLPQGYGSLAQICALVKENTHAKSGDSIDRVTFAIGEAASHAAGQPYIAHILTRLRENPDLNLVDIKGHDMGYKEWLLVSGQPWGVVTASNSGYGPNAMTGIFKLSIGGTDIEVHNHFKKKGGEQYSLHLKHGKGTFDRGPELDPKKDKTVYALISNRCLAAYTTWVGNKGWDLYTVPK